MKAILLGVAAMVAGVVSLVGTGRGSGALAPVTRVPRAEPQPGSAFIGGDAVFAAARVSVGAPVARSVGAATPRLRTHLLPGRYVELLAREGTLRVGGDRWYFADWDGDGGLTSGDFLAYISAYQGREAGADLNHDGVLNAADFSEFLRQYSVAQSRSITAC
jgi:hypothetical protein